MTTTQQEQESVRSDCPTCEKCGAPVTTGMMAVLCPRARACAFVMDDDHWETVEEFREDLGISRARGPA